MADLVPSGAWDTHIHVFDPDHYPYSTARSYTPGAALLTEYPKQITGCENVVIVHASVQDPSPVELVSTLTNPEVYGFKSGSLRGLATLDPGGLDDNELESLHAAGVRGIRLHNMAWGHGQQSGAEDIMKDIKATSAKTARLGWAIGIFCPLTAWAAMTDELLQLDSRTRLIADHLGSSFPGCETQPEFASFVSLVRKKRIHVKISGFERMYHSHPDGMDSLKGIISAIVEAGPDQIIFGSDWPHTGLGVARQGKSREQRLSEVEPFRKVPDAEHIRALRAWIPDDDVWHKLFVSNPEQLFA